MTDDVRYSDRVFSIQQIPNFHRVDATNLIETVTFRQSCCRPGSRHRSCFALWTFEITFYPSDDSPSAATISQGTTNSSIVGCTRLTWALSGCLCCAGAGVSASTSASAASSARSSSSAKSGSVRGGYKVSCGVIITCVAQSLRNMHGVAEGFTL